MFGLSKVVNSSIFFDYFYKKFKKAFKIKKADLKAIYLIVLEELEAELLDEKEFNIKNFGCFSLKKRNRKFSYSILEQKLVPCKSRYTMNFSLAHRLSRLINQSADLDNTKFDD